MGIIDIVLGIILLYGLIKGVMKGLLVEVAGLLALILGIYGAIHFSFYAKNELVKFVSWDAKYISLVAFAITFIAIVIAIALAGKILTKLASAISLGFLNKILGAVFGCMKVGLILSVLLGFVDRANGIFPFLSSEQKENSILFHPVKNLAPTIFPKLMEMLDNNKIYQEDKNEEQNI